LRQCAEDVEQEFALRRGRVPFEQLPLIDPRRQQGLVVTFVPKVPI